MIQTLLVGYGYWGRILAENLTQHPTFFLAGVQDANQSVILDARANNLHAYASLEDAMQATHPQLVVIAAPIGSMEVPAMRALQGYAHVMMAKPGVDSLAAFDRVLRVADYAQRSVVVDYTMLMHSTWNTILHEQHRLGGIEKFHSVRSAIGNRTGAPIVLDMLVHDLSLLVSLNPDREWLLEYARVSETEVVARFVSGKCEAILEASTTSTEQERSVYLAGAGLTRVGSARRRCRIKLGRDHASVV
jgi:predicted dehydrogenase